VGCFLSRGYFHFNRGEYELALTAYEQALKLDAHDADSYSGKGDTLKELHRYKEALAAYQQALCLDPLDLEVQTRRNNILKMLRRRP
jgi:tetratricopeptide (TPR) repeat protein